MSVKVGFEHATAVRVARHFESMGMLDAALESWIYASSTNPYDRLAREKLGELLFDRYQSRYPPGSVERSRFILDVIGQTFPIAKLACAYFENLEQLLSTRTRRIQPGNVVLAVGSGRSGSTTLTAAFASVAQVCATHENPPTIFWAPVEEQVQFHVDRFRRLADYYSLVIDASHWWLNVLDRLLVEFPNGKVVAVHRAIEPCVTSFLNTKGKGLNSMNHWAPAGNSHWCAANWDPTYPSYPLPPGALADPDAVKAMMIERYVREYNEALELLAATRAGRVILIRTEELSDAATVNRLSDFTGQRVVMPSRSLNVGGTDDSAKRLYRI
jgi:hypothetical protein